MVGEPLLVRIRAHIVSGASLKPRSWAGLTLIGAWLLPYPATAETVTSVRFAEALPKLESIIEQGMERTGVPGLAIVIVHDDDVKYLRGYGVREVGRPDPVDPDTVFQLASMSKPIASTVVATLVGDGLVAWDDPIVKHDAGFQLQDSWVTRNVTLRDMFSHRSGLPDHSGDLLEDLGYGRDEILFRLRYVNPAGPFRASYAYTNFGLTEAAVAAAKAAGRPWEDLSQERLYGPAGMSRTSSRHADFLAAENRAVNSVRAGDKWISGPARDPDAQSPAGGVSSTVRDLGQWLRLQLGDGSLDGKQIVAAAALAETHQPVIVSGTPSSPESFPPFYGLGWIVDTDADGRIQLSHSGAFNLGIGTTVRLVPAERLGIAVLTNGFPVGLAEGVSRSFLDLVFTGEVERDWVEAFGQLMAQVMKPDYGEAFDAAVSRQSSSAALSAASYTGTYGNELFGEVTIFEEKENGALTMELGPENKNFPLQHIDRDTFAYQPVGENAFGPSAVTFTVEADRSNAVTIENLDLHGQGTFIRIPSEP